MSWLRRKPQDAEPRVYLAREAAEKLKMSQYRIRRLSKGLRDNKSSIRRGEMLMVLTGRPPRKRPPKDRGKTARNVRKEWIRKRMLL